MRGSVVRLRLRDVALPGDLSPASFLRAGSNKGTIRTTSPYTSRDGGVQGTTAEVVNTARTSMILESPGMRVVKSEIGNPKSAIRNSK